MILRDASHPRLRRSPPPSLKPARRARIPSEDQAYQASMARMSAIARSAGRGCTSIFARPKSSALRGPSRYIIVDSVGEFGLKVDSILPARADDLHEVWARRDLKHRGCRPPGKYYISYRHCDEALQQNLPWWERPLPSAPSP
jgi:hypothetical protein